MKGDLQQGLIFVALFWTAAAVLVQSIIWLYDLQMRKAMTAFWKRHEERWAAEPVKKNAEEANLGAIFARAFGEPDPVETKRTIVLE